jgi:carboxymethylenebutenolidase
MSTDLQNDIAGVLARADMTRREVVATSLAAGFALAVRPVSAETISTSSEGLTAGEVKIPVSDGSIPGYRAMPGIRQGRHHAPGHDRLLLGRTHRVALRRA